MKRPIVRRYLISYNLVLLQFAEDTHPRLYPLTIPQTPHFLKAKPESFFIRIATKGQSGQYDLKRLYKDQNPVKPGIQNPCGFVCCITGIPQETGNQLLTVQSAQSEIDSQ